MKTAHRLFYALSLLFFTFLFTLPVRAHFGSKGPFGGTVSCAITADSLVYLGTTNGGVYISSTNKITAWTARPVGLTSGKITALAHSGKDLYAATADNGVYIFNGYVVKDRYWKRVSNGLGNLRIRSLIALDSTTLLAGTDGNGLYKTTDKGANWTAVNSAAISNAVVTGIVKAGSRLFLLSQNEGVFISDDSGATWTGFNDVHTLGIGGTNSLAYNSANDVLLIANNNGLFTLGSASTATTAQYSSAQTGLTAGSAIRGITSTSSAWYIATDKGVYTSAVSSVNWSAINTGLPSANATAIVAAQSRLIAGIFKYGVFKATAGVHNWAALNTGFNNQVTRCMAAYGDSLVVAVTENGVYVSTNLATTYKLSNNGLTDSLNVNDITVASDDLVAATANGGVFISKDLGKSWSALNNGLSSTNIKKLFCASHHLFAIDASGHVFECLLPSGDWEAIQDGLPQDVKPTCLAFYGGDLFLGTLGHGVYTRDLHRGDWASCNSGLTDLNVTAVTVSGNTIFAGTDGSGVFASDYKHISWSATAPTSIDFTTMVGLDGTKIQAMGCYAGYVYASYKGGLLTTSDCGKTWIAGGNQFNLPSYTDVRKICFVSSRVFVTTENNGLYSNSLSELTPLPDTMFVSHEELDFDAEPDEERTLSVTCNRDWTVSCDQPWVSYSKTNCYRNEDIYVGVSPNHGGKRSAKLTLTAGKVIRIVYISQAATSGINEADALNVSLRIYPNPAKGVFTIDLSAKDAVVNAVSVYDLNGRMILDKPVGKGSFPASFELDHPSGIYMVQVRTNKGVISQRLVLE